MIKTTSGPALEKSGDLAAVLTNLSPGEILFIDEAHRINPIIEEVLYPAMEARKAASRCRQGTIGADIVARSSAVHVDRRDDA